MSIINIDRAMIERALEAMMNLPVLGWLPEQEKISFEVITILRTALEQPEQEPVAWMLKTGHGTEFKEQLTDELKALTWKGKPMWTPLYTSPPQREWVGLTEDQFLEASRLAEEGNYMVAFQRIQQWLKEKNT